MLNNLDIIHNLIIHINVTIIVARTIFIFHYITLSDKRSITSEQLDQLMDAFLLLNFRGS